MKEIQQKVKEVTKTLSLANTPELCCLDLSSEVGELSKEILELTNYGKRRKRIFNPNLARELGDTFYSLISIANIYNINLEKELMKSLEKYKRREADRDSSKRKIKLEPIVLAKNFLCLNSVVGCKNDCIYCYKHGWDIENPFIPQVVFESKEIVANLLNHRYYHPNIPLAVHNSATDPFQKEVAKTTFKILDGIEALGIPNIVGLITKEYLSFETIKRIESYKNIRPIVFVTYSLLPKKYERVVDERRLETMKNLSKSKLKKVLYFRPIIKGVNDNEETVKKIVDLGEKYFDCIVRSSIKVDINTIEYMAKKGVYIDPNYDIGLNIHDSVKQMLPGIREKVDLILAKSKIPYYKKTSCAISYLFEQSDYNTQWIKPKIYCSKLCPKKQSKKCQLASGKKVKSKNIAKILEHLGLKYNFSILKDKVVIKADDAFYSDIKYMRMVLNFPVMISKNGHLLTAEEYDRKYVNIDRSEIRKQIKKLGIHNY